MTPTPNTTSPAVEAVASNTGLKNFIVGKMWATSQDGVRPGTLRINRDLPRNIILKPDMTLFVNKNTKREGKNDADYSISILLPTATADALILEEHALAEARKARELAETNAVDATPM